MPASPRWRSSARTGGSTTGPATSGRRSTTSPARPTDRLLASLAPHHPIDSRWRWPDDAEQGWLQVREQVLRPAPRSRSRWTTSRLPFRPAYQDVHSNHLVIVHGFDDETADRLGARRDPAVLRRRAAAPVLTAARAPANRSVHARDMFFADNPIGNRWLQLHGEPGSAAHRRPGHHRRLFCAATSPASTHRTTATTTRGSPGWRVSCVTWRPG